MEETIVVGDFQQKLAQISENKSCKIYCMMTVKCLVRVKKSYTVIASFLHGHHHSEFEVDLIIYLDYIC